ncbi:MAG: glycosyltransferase family 2 protein [Clostridia bacterium]|nr:MAG: glycosyltransferase family 2 protein [Clostridia bacterium]
MLAGGGMGDGRMRVSIALATYNGERYLQEQLDSFMRQTRLPDEVVVCDDGSTDDTLNILNSFIGLAPFSVRVYRNAEKLGYSKNFERAINLCSGDVVFLCDQDDVWFPEKLKTVLNIFQSVDRPYVVINDAEITDGGLNPVGLTVLGQIRSTGLSTDSFISGCCTAFRTELRPLIIPIPQARLGHDLWIHQIGIALNKRVLVHQPLQYYRRHGENTSQWFTNRTTRATKFDLMRYYGSGDSHVACTQRLALLSMLSERLAHRWLEVKDSLDEDLELNKVLGVIQREQKAVRRRLALLERNRLLRLLPAWSMLRRGDYRYFSGWMSFVKDLIY